MRDRQDTHGDCREILKTIQDQSINCCVTSPPYFGLRDYGVAGQIGLEQTPEQFVEQIVSVFREVRRVLRPDGTLWLNLGDSYATHRAGMQEDPMKTSTLARTRNQEVANKASRECERYLKCPTLPEKNLIGVPWMVAFALRADGWYLRQDIIWSKPNPMPESVTDRCTKAHEYLFLLTKSPRYYYDQDAILEPIAQASVERLSQDVASQNGSNRVPGKTNGSMKAVGRAHLPGNKSHKGTTAYEDGDELMRTKAGLVDYAEKVQNNPLLASWRNKRSVWTVTTQPFKDAHFATFPPALIEPCILAGCPKSGTVLDPFGGAGTTGLVADRLQRNSILIELNHSYAAMARNRIEGDAPLLANGT